MEKILTNLMAVAVAVSLIAFLGCGAGKEDPNAANNAAQEDVSNDPDDAGEISGKGEPNIKPKDKDDDNEAPPKEDC